MLSWTAGYAIRRDATAQQLKPAKSFLCSGSITYFLNLVWLERATKVLLQEKKLSCIDTETGQWYSFSSSVRRLNVPSQPWKTLFLWIHFPVTNLCGRHRSLIRNPNFTFWCGLFISHSLHKGLYGTLKLIVQMVNAFINFASHV